MLKLSNDCVIARPLLRSKSFIINRLSCLANKMIQPSIRRFWFVRVFIGQVGSFLSCRVSVSSGWQSVVFFIGKSLVTFHPDFLAQYCPSAELNSH